MLNEIYRKQLDLESVANQNMLQGVSVSTLWRSLEAYVIDRAPISIRGKSDLHVSLHRSHSLMQRRIEEFLDILERGSESPSSHEEKPSNEQDDAAPRNSPAFADYKGIPLTILKRHRRERLLDSLTECLVRKDEPFPPTAAYRQRFALVLMLMQAPNATADLVRLLNKAWKYSNN